MYNTKIIFAVIFGSCLYFLRDAIYVSTIFFKFTPAVKNVHTVELTYVGELLYCSGILHKELNKITKYIGQSCGLLLSVQENTEVLPQATTVPHFVTNSPIPFFVIYVT